LLQQLILLVQILPILCLHSRNSLTEFDVDSVIEIAREEANLMVHGHGTITEPKDFWVNNLGRDGWVWVTKFLENIGGINVTLSGMRLPSGQMTIDKGDGSIVNDQTCCDSTLIARIKR
jgi:hypothetical protein